MAQRPAEEPIRQSVTVGVPVDRAFAAFAGLFSLIVIAGYISHIPGSLGVLEAGMLLALPQVPTHSLLASLEHDRRARGRATTFDMQSQSFCIFLGPRAMSAHQHTCHALI